MTADPTGPDDASLVALSAAERALLRRILALQDYQPVLTPAAARQRRWFLRLLIGACLLLIPWIGLLAITLPPQYQAGHWQAAWIGLDLALLTGLALTAWAAWRRRQIVILLATITATLLTCDAWFDLATASTPVDLTVSAASAVFAELPLASALFLLTHRLLHLTIRTVRAATGHTRLDLPLWRLPLFGIGPTSTPER